MSSICKFINYALRKKLYKVLQEPDWSFCLISNLKSLYFMCSHLLYHSLSFAVTHWNVLLLLVIRFTARYHLLYHALSFIVPLVAISCHSLSFAVTRWTSRCHLLSLDVPLVCIFRNDLNKLSSFHQSFKINFLKVDRQVIENHIQKSATHE